MIGVGAFSCTRMRACAWALGALACAALAPALSATPALAACANEQLRNESNANPATGQPYSTELPECRAYEMVSPPYKQSHDATAPITGSGIPVAPDGETAGFGSEGDFAEPNNYSVNFFPENSYLSRRGSSGWSTLSTFAPRNLVDHPDNLGLNADFSPDLRSVEVSCGELPLVRGDVLQGTGVSCAKRLPDGSWVGTALHTGASEGAVSVVNYLGGSEDLSRVIVQPKDFPLLSSDTSAEGIYELPGVGTGLEELEQPQLVNVDKSGKELFYKPMEQAEPFVGNGPRNKLPEGSRYHAISNSGGTVFFTAIPSGEQQPAGQKQTVYARVDAKKTVAVSNPSQEECTACSLAKKPAQAATFQGASADGSKVFFTTKQQLLEGDTDGTNNLYEYEFPTAEEPSARLVEVSKVPTPGAEANVQGVLRNSSDGSHIYFVASGILANEENQEHKKAVAGQPNLYGYDTRTGTTKFVATLSVSDNRGCSTFGPPCELWGGSAGKDRGNRFMQITPNGRYLVFSSLEKLAGDTNSRAAYRYDFETGELTWISHGAPGFKEYCEQQPNAEGKEKSAGEKERCENEGRPALIEPLDANNLGATAGIDDWARAISENGEYVVFTTAERLQANAAEGVTNVYLWHNGTVSMISADGGASPAISSSGRDIFFTTANRLVGQDTDNLRDLYDARVGGGFPAPAEPACSSDACQGSPSPLPSFAPSVSSLLPAGGNITPPPPPPPPPPVKQLTEAQLLAKALAACKSKPRNKRAACELQARKRYGAQQLAELLKACKRQPKNKRHACESQARKRYGR